MHAQIHVKTTVQKNGKRRYKFMWRGLPWWPVEISGPFVRDGSASIIPRGYGLEKCGYDKLSDTYFYRRSRYAKHAGGIN